MKESNASDWLGKIIVETGLINFAHLNEREQFILESHLYKQIPIAQIAVEIDLTNERVRQVLENGLGKVLIFTKYLIATNASKYLRSNVDSLENDSSQMKAYSLNQGFFEMDANIEVIKFSVRASRIMKHFGIKTISDLRKISFDELNNLDQAGVKTVNEIVNRASEFGVIIK